MRVGWIRYAALAVVVGAFALLGSTIVNAQGAISSGETLTGTIAPIGDSDVWTFSATAGAVIIVRVGQISETGSFTPRVRLFSPAAALLDTGSGANAAEAVATAASGGTYSVIVDDAVGTTATGTYRISLSVGGAAVSVTPGDQGGPLTNGSNHSGTIDLGDLDLWTITASAGDSIVVRMSEAVQGSTLIPYLRIYGPAGNLLSTSFAASVAEVAVTAAANGTYVVVAGDATSGFVGVGDYRITMAKTGSAITISPGDEGGPMTNGAIHTGTIDLGDIDAWTITASAGESIVVRMGEVVPGSTLTPYLRIYGPAGNLMDSSFAASAAEVAVTAAANGTYLVIVGDATSGFVGVGDYQMTLAKTGSAVSVSPGDEGGPLTNGAIHTGTITLGDLDLWTIGANAGESIVVRMGEVVPGSTLTPYLRIYGPGGNLLASSFAASAAEVAVTAAANGTYLVVAGDATSGFVGVGDYRINLAKTGSAVTVSPGDEGGPMTNGAVHTGTIALGDLDLWTITANAGESIVVRMGEAVQGSTLTPYLRIYGPGGNLMDSGFAASATEVAVTAAANGTYLVVAADATSGFVGVGDYKLTLAKTGSPVTVSPGDEGGPMTNGAIHTGTIGLGDLDLWTITANAGESIVVRMGEIVPGSALTPYLRVYAPGGSLVGSSFAASAAEVAITAAANGTYLVVAGDATSGFVGVGDYRINMAKTGSAVTVSPGDEGGSLPTGISLGTIDLGDLDVYTLGAKAGDQIAVTMEELVPGSALSPWLRLYGPSGALVTAGSGAAVAQVSVAAPTTGTYLLVATDATSGLTGTGTYRLTRNAGASTNADLANLVPSVGSLAPAFASSTLNYSAVVVSLTNTITLTPTVADPAATVTVNGVPVASGQPSGPITLNPGANAINVVVTAFNGVATRTYTVNVTYYAAAACTYALAPVDLPDRPAAGGGFDVIVTVSAGCPVTATSFQSWVVVANITPNGPTTTVSLQIAANAGLARATAIRIADRLYSITQLAP